MAKCTFLSRKSLQKLKLNEAVERAVRIERCKMISLQSVVSASPQLPHQIAYQLGQYGITRID